MAWRPASAATDTWTGGGGDGTWTNAANWGGTAPSANDDLVFSGSANLSTTNTFAANTTFNSITFDATAGSFTLAGNAITVAGNVTNSSAQTQTLSLAMQLSGATTCSCSGSTLISGVLSGSGGIVKTGAGTLILSGANSYAGGTTITSGTLQLGTGAVNGTIGSGSYAIASAGRLYLNYATAIASGTGTWSNNLTGSGVLELNSAQAVNGSAQWGPNRSTSTVFSSSFTGTLQVDNGRIDASPAGLGGTSAIIIASNGQFLAWTGSYAVPIVIAGNGWGEGGQPGALRAAGGSTVSWSGGVTLSAAAGISAQSNSTFTITGSLTGAFPLELETSSFASATLWLTPSATVQNACASTQIDAGLTVMCGNQYALSTGALAMNGGTLKLNGSNAAVANLSGSGGTIANSSAGAASTLTVGADGSTTSYGGALTDGGAQPLALAKLGAGALTLTGGSSATGATSVSAGSLILGSGGSLGNTAITVAGTATFAALPAVGTATIGTATAGSSGGTLILGPGTSFSMVDGAVGTCSVLEQTGFSGTALSINGATLAFDLGSAGADALAVGGMASVSGTNSISVSGIGSSLTPGSTTVISAAGGLNGGSWQFSGGGTSVQVTVGSTPYVLTLGSSATAVTLTVSPAISIAWTTGSDPKSWSLGGISVGAVANTIASGLDLGITNVGSSTLDLSIAASAASPGGWLPAPAAGANAFLLRADSSGAALGAPGDPASYPVVLTTTAQSLLANVMSGASSGLSLYFQGPTSISSGSATPQTITVTITAALSP